MEFKFYRTYPTRNHSGGQYPIKPRGFVWHTTEGHGMSYLLQLLSGEVGRGDGVRPSTHFLVSLRGEVYQLAPWAPDKAYCCWHAGKSAWDGVTGLNRYTLGVEIEHRGSEPYPQAQVDACVWLASTVSRAYTGTGCFQWGLLEHKQIAPTRKSDPTGPGWPALKAKLEEAWRHPWAESEEDPLKPEELIRLNRGRVSDIKQSYDIAIINAKLEAVKQTLDIQSWPAVVNDLTVQRDRDVANEKAKLGI